MPTTAAYVAACRAAVYRLPEWTELVALGSLSDTATRADRVTRWGQVYGRDSTGSSLFMRLYAAVRGVVNAEADKLAASSANVVTASERESVYQELAAELLPDTPRPQNEPEELAELQRLLDEDIV